MRNTYGMQAAFGTVVWIVCGVGAVAALAALILSGRTWQEYGRSHLLFDHQRTAGPEPGSAAAARERDAEIRELLEARNARRLRRGQAPIDVQQELAQLTAVPVDPALRAEIRDLVLAQNHRRLRRGQAPLDVETETERQIAELGCL
jgi:hypothetical protein